MNDLDRAIIAVGRSRSATPELYRQLCEGEFWVLLPFHPEIEDTNFELKNGMQMPFVRVEDKEGELVVLYSSAERVRESLKRSKVPPKAYSTGTIEAKVLLQMLGAIGLRAVVNKNCRTTGELILPPDLMRDLANGSALEPLGTGGDGPGEKRALDILNAADYPTDLVQPMFEVLKQHRNFRAAWIFGVPGTGPGTDVARRYGVLVLMDPRDAVIFHDFNMVVAAVENPQDKVELAFANEDDTAEIARLFQQAPPFFVAADYGKPPKAEE